MTQVTPLPPKTYVDASGAVIGQFAGIEKREVTTDPETGEETLGPPTVEMPPLPAGAIEAATDPPSSKHIWDGNAWQPPDPADVLAEWRATASIPREDFAVAALEAGLATEAEAEQWGAGNSLPGWVATAINGAKAPDGSDVFPTPAAKMRARLEALREPRVARGSDLIEILRADQGMTPEQVDVLFGGPPT